MSNVGFKLMTLRSRLYVLCSTLLGLSQPGAPWVVLFGRAPPSPFPILAQATVLCNPLSRCLYKQPIQLHWDRQI